MPGAAVVSGLVVHQPDQLSAGDGRVWSAQTVVLVVLDALGVKGKHPLTYKAASLTLVIEAVTVVAILGVVIAYSQMPPGLVIAHLTPDVVLITAIWVVGLLLFQRAQKHLPWQEKGEAPESQPESKGHSKAKSEHDSSKTKSTGASVAVFAAPIRSHIPGTGNVPTGNFHRLGLGTTG